MALEISYVKRLYTEEFKSENPFFYFQNDFEYIHFYSLLLHKSLKNLLSLNHSFSDILLLNATVCMELKTLLIGSNYCFYAN